MKRRASFHARAKQEILEATRYYNLESPGLGDIFLNEVERVLASILEHPEAAIVLRGKVRRKLLRKFPYGILYSVAPDGIRILAVMNQKRRPFYWQGRS
ncbi:MAG: type II toxin-antitoxin system RelE/ParE family toxin [Candidatus Manganitrophaceae bacterium]